MKTKEELSVIKEEVKTLNAKLALLSEEELEQVTGGGKAGWAAIFCAVFADNAHLMNFPGGNNQVRICTSYDIEEDK